MHVRHTMSIESDWQVMSDWTWDDAAKPFTHREMAGIVLSVVEWVAESVNYQYWHISWRCVGLAMMHFDKEVKSWKIAASFKDVMPWNYSEALKDRRYNVALMTASSSSVKALVMLWRNLQWLVQMLQFAKIWPLEILDQRCIKIDMCVMNTNHLTDMKASLSHLQCASLARASQLQLLLILIIGRTCVWLPKL